jgi:pimeloyl-ACP methyl ester carboxylesterase
MTRIPFDDFSGSGQALHFAHANAYPPGCYRQLLGSLAINYRVTAIHFRPLWSESPPEEMSSWGTLAEDLVRFFNQEGMRGVIGVGHSLGGVATAKAALIQPDLFRALILIEPVFLSPAVMQKLAAISSNGDLLALPLVKTALKRRDQWDSRQEAFAHFRQKSVFDRLTDEALWDYVKYGLTNDNGSLHLTYRPAWEAHIYALQVNDMWDSIPKISQPTLALRGSETNTLLPDAWELWQQKQPEAVFTEVEGAGHLLPLERPAVVARAIDSFVEDLIDEV